MLHYSNMSNPLSRSIARLSPSLIQVSGIINIKHGIMSLSALKHYTNWSTEI